MLPKGRTPCPRSLPVGRWGSLASGDQCRTTAIHLRGVRLRGAGGRAWDAGRPEVVARQKLVVVTGALKQRSDRDLGGELPHELQVPGDRGHRPLARTLPVRDVERGLGVESAVVGEVLAVAEQATVRGPGQEPDDLANLTLLQDAGEHGGYPGATGEMADDATRDHPVSGADNQRAGVEQRPHEVCVGGHVKGERLDHGFGPRVAELLGKAVDLHQAQVPRSELVADQVVRKQPVGIDERDRAHAVAAEGVCGGRADAARADDRDTGITEAGDWPSWLELIPAQAWRARQVQIGWLCLLTIDPPGRPFRLPARGVRQCESGPVGRESDPATDHQLAERFGGEARRPHPAIQPLRVQHRIDPVPYS